MSPPIKSTPADDASAGGVSNPITGPVECGVHRIPSKRGRDKVSRWSESTPADNASTGPVYNAVTGTVDYGNLHAPSKRSRGKRGHKRSNRKPLYVNTPKYYFDHRSVIHPLESTFSSGKVSPPLPSPPGSPTTTYGAPSPPGSHITFPSGPPYRNGAWPVAVHDGLSYKVKPAIEDPWGPIDPAAEDQFEQMKPNPPPNNFVFSAIFELTDEGELVVHSFGNYD